MRTLCIWIYILGGSMSLAAQSPAPGGVGGAFFWLQSCAINEGTSIFQEQKKSPHRREFPRGQSLNYHSSSVVNSLTLGHNLNALGKATIFTVVQPANKEEEGIWELRKNHEKMILMTSHRVADLEKYQFINLMNPSGQRAYISHYFHHLNDPGVNLEFTLAPDPGAIPINKMQAGLSELIVFDRVISPGEKSAVESYLSIKYGIPLNQTTPTHYKDANQQIIWDANKYKKFNRDIVAIGRDDRSSLHQKQTGCDALIISSGPLAKSNDLNHSSIPDGSYLFWSHNGVDNIWKDDVPNKELARTWLAVAKDSMQYVPTYIYLREEKLPVVAGPGMIWWLDIYPNEEGVSLKNKISHPFQSNGEEAESICVKDLKWDLDGSGSDIFKLSVGPAFKVEMDIKETSCQIDAAALHLKVFGGVPPYDFELSHQQGHQASSRLRSGDSYLDFDHLPAGTYDLVVIDANRQTFSSQVKINHTDGIAIEIPERFTLDKKQLILEPKHFVSSLNPQITWILPGGDNVVNKPLEVKNAGVYYLVVEKDGCFNSRSFRVDESPTSNLQEVLLYPNPITCGNYFEVYIRLRQTTPVDVEILDVNGRRLSNHHLSGKQEYHLEEKAEMPGTYILKVTQLRQVYSIPFIVS